MVAFMKRREGDFGLAEQKDANLARLFCELQVHSYSLLLAISIYTVCVDFIVSCLHLRDCDDGHI